MSISYMGLYQMFWNLKKKSVLRQEQKTIETIAMNMDIRPRVIQLKDNDISKM